MNGITLRLPRLHDAQQYVIGEQKRFNAVVCGRRWGKTWLGIDRAIWGVLAGLPVGWFAPSYKILSDAWRDLLRRTLPLTRSTNMQDHRIEYVGGGSLDCWSLDRPNAGRGRRYGVVVIDEAAMVLDLKEAWEAAILPTLTDLEGDAWFLSTPRGYDDFAALYEMGQNPDRPEWASWRMPTSTNPYMKPEAIALIRQSMDERFFAQEYEASFEEMAGRVCFKFDRQENVRADLVDTGGPLLIGMDFNVAPMSAVVCVRAADQLHIIGEIELQNSNTDEMCQAIKARYPGRAITVYPDPSGSARKTSAPVGQTDFAIINRAGFGIVAPNAAPPVVDRVNEANALCCNADGVRRLFVHPRCTSVIRSFAQLTYKDGMSVIDKTSGLDHCFDAATYLIHMEFPLRQGGTFSRIKWG